MRMNKCDATAAAADAAAVLLMPTNIDHDDDCDDNDDADDNVRASASIHNHLEY